jgi:hypothetical protein
MRIVLLSWFWLSACGVSGPAITGNIDEALLSATSCPEVACGSGERCVIFVTAKGEFNRCVEETAPACQRLECPTGFDCLAQTSIPPKIFCALVGP